LSKRIIACLDIDAGRVVKGVRFAGTREVGDPVQLARRYDEEGIDELVFYDISASAEGRRTTLQTVEATAEQVFIPLTVGGGVASVEQVRELLRAGSDKVSLNTAAVADPSLITAAAERFGSQCVVLSIDARRRRDASGRWDGGWEVVTHGGRRSTGLDAVDWARRGEALGAGELVLNSIDADGVRAVNPAVRGPLLGGLRCTRDAVVEPGLVLGALRVTLEATGRYTWLPRRQVVDVGTGAGGTAVAVDQLGDRHAATVVLLCIGDRLTGLGGRVGTTLAAAPLRKCRLQMLQTAPTSVQLTTALADGDSLRYYPAYDLPGRSALPAPSAATDEWGMQLLVVQRAGGGLTIGDTHTYEEPFDFAVEERPYGDLVARAEAVLGWPVPPVVRRWAGVYTAVTDERIYYRTAVDAGVVAVTGAAGRGMTLAPAIAEETWEELTR